MQYNTAEGARHHFYQVCFCLALNEAVSSALGHIDGRTSDSPLSMGAGGALCESAEAICEEEKGTGKEEKA